MPYVGFAIGGAVLVACAATVQHLVVLGVELHPTMYAVPVVVGSVFGWTLRRVLNLSAMYRRNLDLLAQREQEVRNLNRDLERRVQERTEALQLKQEELVRAQKLEAVGRLAASIAHDFNNSLTGIVGWTSLLLSDLPEGDGSRNTVEQIAAAASRASATTRRLLTFTRRQPSQLRALELDECVGDLEEMLRQMLGERHTLTTELRAGPARVIADCGDLEQVVLNLVINARDAMPEGGRITLATDVIASDRTAADGGATTECVRLEVRDAGTGMAEETAASAFEPFYTTKPTGEGTGLGLSVVRSLVESFGGEVSIVSSVGEGTVVAVELPRTAGDSVEPGVATAPSPVRGGTESVLLVEDDDSIRSVLERVLTGQGYRVVSTGDAEQARIHFAEDRVGFDLLVTDLVLPGDDGARLARELNGRKPELRVLLMSGYSGDPSLPGFGPDGELDLLEKPFAPGELLERVRASLDRAAREPTR